ncbi:hypothetical protein [Patulibacter defluvii]|uniref:hypothetical protein n=1 Tax=Patulibacter defluvii TaxID=3095358 RepID=UPI002A74F164|nr:hypothetical protein [Patulibacter sp. DM4]
MSPTRTTVVLLAAGLALPATAGAAPKSITRTVTSGAVAATATSVGGSFDGSGAGVQLKIARNGATLFDGVPAGRGCVYEGKSSCTLLGWEEDSSAVVVRDLDGDAEPEVVVDQYTGGAHCCVVTTVLSLKPDASGYRQSPKEFRDEGYRLVQRPNPDGGAAVPVFASGDIRFIDLYTSHAASSAPVQLWRWTGQAGWIDVTDSYPADVRADQKRQRKLLDRIVRGREYESRGVAAAWAADGYRLGQRRSVRRTLDRMAARGQLAASFSQQRSAAVRRSQSRAFVRGLDHRLTRWGYKR